MFFRSRRKTCLPGVRSVTGLVLLLSFLSLPGSSVFLATARIPRISPEFLARMAADPEQTQVAWVFFEDKGFSGPEEMARALDILRSRPSGAEPDFRKRKPDALDLPVCERYIREIRESGIRIRQVSRWLNAISIEASGAAIERLATRSFVRRIQPVLRGRGPAPQPEREFLPDFPHTGGIPIRSMETTVTPEEILFYGSSFAQDEQIGIPALHRLGYTGAGVRIAILDSGFQPDHRALAGRHVVAQRDFIVHGTEVYDPERDTPESWRHGTATWSLLGGYDPGFLIGGAYEAEIILCKTEDIRGEYPREEDTYVAALEWADSLGADVVSASLGYWLFDGLVGYTFGELDGNTAATTIAVDIAVEKGMSVVNAAGNEGPRPGTLIAPADADLVISAGAVDENGRLTGFSSRGPTVDGRIKPEIVARGANNFIASSDDGLYRRGAGTSYATPMTAGAIGLILEAHPDWDGIRVREAIMATADRALSPDNNYGHGIVSAAAAAALEPRHPARFPAPFSLLSPPVGDSVSVRTPILAWSPALSEIPGDVLRYTVIVGREPHLGDGRGFDAGESTSWSPEPGALEEGVLYHWTVKAVNAAGYERKARFASRFFLKAEPKPPEPPAPPLPALAITGCRPNPFRGTTWFTVSNAEPLNARLSVYDVTGREVARLLDGSLPAGEHAMSWNGATGQGFLAPPGVYHLHLTGADRVIARKLVLVR